MTSNYQYCIVLTADELQQACEVISGYGSSWVTGWYHGLRCAWCDDQVTATKFAVLFGYTMEVVKRP